MSCVRTLKKKDSEEIDVIVTGVTDTTSSETPVPEECDMPTQLVISPISLSPVAHSSNNIPRFDKQYSTATCKTRKKRKYTGEPGVTTRSKRFKTT